MKELGEGFDGVTFPRVSIVTETAIVSFRTLPVSIPLPTIFQSSLFTLFCSLILDQGVSLTISVSGLKNS